MASDAGGPKAATSTTSAGGPKVAPSTTSAGGPKAATSTTSAGGPKAAPSTATTKPHPLLGEADVLKVAKLARLELGPEEVGRMVTELSAIVGYVQKLGELDTSDVPPTSHVHVDRLPLRQDEPQVSLSHADALAESPRVAHDGFAVPGFVED